MIYDSLIIGGGAAGFFTAINIAEYAPEKKILILERGGEVLSKVRISGGGRCNLTHAEFSPKSLTTNYPRGERELLGPFHHFMTGDTMAWFEKRGVALKIEEDGRVFPVTDSSETIINCFMTEIQRLGIKVKTKQSVQSLRRTDDFWVVSCKDTDYEARTVVVASGSNPKMLRNLEELGHKSIAQVPSLFTFNIKDSRIEGLPGLSSEAEIELLDKKGIVLKDKENRRADRAGSKGSLLITHWGMSGPVILKLSAWGARELFDCNYQFKIRINWLPGLGKDQIPDIFSETRRDRARQAVLNACPFEIPKRLWQNLVIHVGILNDRRWADITKEEMQRLADELAGGIFTVNGKSTFKEEFVTAGGIDLKEINFKTFESKLLSDLYLAGEVLNIDAVTGGFNFQNAWTGGFLIAAAIAEKY